MMCGVCVRMCMMCGVWVYSVMSVCVKGDCIGVCILAVCVKGDDEITSVFGDSGSRGATRGECD